MFTSVRIRTTTRTPLKEIISKISNSLKSRPDRHLSLLLYMSVEAEQTTQFSNQFSSAVEKNKTTGIVDRLKSRL